MRYFYWQLDFANRWCAQLTTHEPLKLKKEDEGRRSRVQTISDDNLSLNDCIVAFPSPPSKEDL